MAGTAKNDVPNRLALNSVFWTLSAAKVREPAQVPPEKPKADPPRAPQRTHQPPKTSRPPIVRRAASFAGEGEKLLKLFPPSIHRQVRDAFAIQGRNIDEPGDWFEVVSYLFENALSNAFRSIEKNAPRSFAAYVSLAADLLHAIQTEEAVPTSDFFRLTSDFMTMVRTATLVRHAVLSLGKETPAAWIENDVRFGHLMELQKLFENK